MAKTFTVSIVSPQRVIFDGEVSYLFVPGGGGCMGILPDHAALLSSLAAGSFELRLPSPAKSIVFKTEKTGFIEVNKNVVSILLDAADSNVIADLLA
jgi:F-type H+-transporting ATPase subunit epsilon